MNQPKNKTPRMRGFADSTCDSRGSGGIWGSCHDAPSICWLRRRPRRFNANFALKTCLAANPNETDRGFEPAPTDAVFVPSSAPEVPFLPVPDSSVVAPPNGGPTDFNIDTPVIGVSVRIAATSSPATWCSAASGGCSHEPNAQNQDRAS